MEAGQGNRASANRPGRRKSTLVNSSARQPHPPTPSSSSAPTPNVRDASSPEQVRAALSALHARETSLASRLDGLLASQAELTRELGRLDNLRARLGPQTVATRAIASDMLSGAAATAGRLSDRVKELDLEKSRVEDTLGVVEQVAELKACVHGVAGSMGAPQDWEAAAGYVSRATRIPDGVVRGGFAAGVVPSVEVPDPPWVTLESAKESLCGLFLREFERAAAQGDEVKVTRFFKLFPLIGRGDVGLDVYGRYVCQGVAGTARETLRGVTAAQKEGFWCASALAKLFKHVMQIVELHGPLIERHYGPGKVVKVIERLQIEADVQGGIILDLWSDERRIDRKLTDVKSYPFSFLLQSFLPPQRRGTPRTSSPAMGAGVNGAQDTEDEGVNIKEVDSLLSEIAAMLGWWSLYMRFIAGKCKDQDDAQDDAPPIPDVLLKSNLHRKVSEKLMAPYNTMMTFFFRRSVEKAFQLDESPTGLSLNPTKPIASSPPYVITAVDDVIFVVNAVVQRTVSTSQRDVVASAIPTVGRVLGSDFVNMIQRKMRDESYPKPLVPGGFPPEDRIVSFIVLINSLDTANDYLARILENLNIRPADPAGAAPGSVLRDAFPFKRDSAFVASALSNLLSSFTSKTTELLNEGLQVLFNQVVKLRLRPVLSETFRDVDYSLSEEELAEAAMLAEEADGGGGDGIGGIGEDAVARTFERGWEQLMRPVSRLMTPKTYAALLDLTAKHLARVLEKRVWSYAGRTSAVGAVRMERDVSGIVGAVARGGSYAVREPFARVAQILMAANMEDDEWEELAAMPGAAGQEEEDGIEWVLTEEERARARTLVRR